MHPTLSTLHSQEAHRRQAEYDLYRRSQEDDKATSAQNPAAHQSRKKPALQSGLLNLLAQWARS
jgi:hypothetical protein